MVQSDPRIKLSLLNGMEEMSLGIYLKSQSKFLMWKILPVVEDVPSSLMNVIYALSVWTIKASGH